MTLYIETLSGKKFTSQTGFSTNSSHWVLDDVPNGRWVDWVIDQKPLVSMSLDHHDHSNLQTVYDKNQIFFMIMTLYMSPEPKTAYFVTIWQKVWLRRWILCQKPLISVENERFWLFYWPNNWFLHWFCLFQKAAKNHQSNQKTA